MKKYQAYIDSTRRITAQVYDLRKDEFHFLGNPVWSFDTYEDVDDARVYEHFRNEFAGSPYYDQKFLDLIEECGDYMSDTMDDGSMQQRVEYKYPGSKMQFILRPPYTISVLVDFPEMLTSGYRPAIQTFYAIMNRLFIVDVEHYYQGKWRHIQWLEPLFGDVGRQLEELSEVFSTYSPEEYQEFVLESVSSFPRQS